MRACGGERTGGPHGYDLRCIQTVAKEAVHPKAPGLRQVLNTFPAGTDEDLTKAAKAKLEEANRGRQARGRGILPLPRGARGGGEGFTPLRGPKPLTPTPSLLGGEGRLFSAARLTSGLDAVRSMKSLKTLGISSQAKDLLSPRSSGRSSMTGPSRSKPERQNQQRRVRRTMVATAPGC